MPPLISLSWRGWRWRRLPCRIALKRREFSPDKVAKDFAVVGPAARASGIKKDVRIDYPYGGYGDFQLDVPCYEYGDVMARARVRVDEAMSSARLIVEQLASFPAGRDSRARGIRLVQERGLLRSRPPVGSCSTG